jgi:phenylalanyl-tRNA synthetase beta chain
MASITYSKRDLLNLIGKNLSDEQLKEIIDQIKPSVEKITEDEITVEHYADRPDLFGIEGLARAVRLYLGIQKKEKFELRESRLSVVAEKVEVRPFIACAVLKNVELTDNLIKSLMNIQEVLHETFGRKRARVAIGVHDYDEIVPPIKYVSASPAERIIPLEREEEMSLKDVLINVEKGKDYGHIISKADKWPAFVDQKGIFSFPPIINSDRTKVSEKTKNLFLDITGTSEKIVLQTMNILVTNLSERGAKIESVKIDYGNKKIVTPDLSKEKIMVDIEEANEWVGINLSAEKMILALQKMGYEAKKMKDKLEVLIPPYRTDILHQVDIYEDIAIGFGYMNLKPQLPKLPTKGGRDTKEIFTNKVREAAVKLGLQEVLTGIMTNEKDQFDKMNLKREEVAEVENYVSVDYTIMRKWILPNLLKILSVNQHITYPQQIFEVGDVVFLDKKEETQTRNVRKISVAIANSKIGFQDIICVFDELMKNLKIRYKLKERNHSSFISGRCAAIISKNKEIGFIGELKPDVLQNWKMEMPVVAFEISLENLS